MTAESASIARRNALPEHQTFRDTGCSLHPACLTCPEVVCRYDGEDTVGGGLRARQSAARQAAIVALRRLGWSPMAIAAELHLSRRTVFRRLALERA